jgi:hypothetical protein
MEMTVSYPRAMAAHKPLRSLEDYLDELQRRYDALPMQSKERGELATRIREVEIEIDARSPI